MNTRAFTTLVAGCLAATTMAVGACNQENRTAADRNQTNAPAESTTARNAEPDDARAMTVTGCLQKTGTVLNHFVITESDTPPSSPVGTSGSAADQSKVAKEKQAAAAHSYRLSGGDTDDMNSYVGKKVTVTGTVAERGTAATSGTSSDDHKNDQKIDADDLTELNVTRLEKVADSCGQAAAPSKR